MVLFWIFEWVIGTFIWLLALVIRGLFRIVKWLFDPNTWKEE